MMVKSGAALMSWRGGNDSGKVEEDREGWKLVMEDKKGSRLRW
jgi:hypothetical protein